MAPDMLETARKLLAAGQSREAASSRPVNLSTATFPRVSATVLPPLSDMALDDPFADPQGA
jgi:hypothetical protein